jgi:FMN phosphatase YigB (HAD superfamily)
MNGNKRINWVIWDMDGVLYPYTQPLIDTFRQAACNAVRKVVNPNLSDGEIMFTLAESSKKYGGSFEALAKKGYDHDKIQQLHHRNLNHNLIPRDRELIKAFARASRQGISHGILTQSVVCWRDKVLERTGLQCFFDKRHCITGDMVNYMKKSQSPEAFKKILDATKAAPEETAFIEDTAKNLKHAYALGMYTIHINRGKPLDVIPEYINYHCPEPTNALAHIEYLNRLDMKPGLVIPAPD